MRSEPNAAPTPPPTRPREQPRLARRISLPTLVLYGLGTTVGAGIYALMGEVAGLAGLWAPVAFLLAAMLAGFAALSLAELSARHPRAAGEAVYVKEGFGSRRLSVFVGIAVALAGAISAATVARAFAAYAGGVLTLPGWVWIVGLVAVAGGVAARGIGEAAWLAAALTIVEVGGLLLVVWVTREALGSLPERWPDLVPPPTIPAWTAIVGASVLCFYGFLGFEDMVNVAEEVRDVRRSMPLAIVLTLVATLLLYVTLATSAILTVPPDELAGSEAPLALIYGRATGEPPWLVTLIGALAMSNGALIQVVKASRILYGLADQGALPARLARVHPVTHTPLLSTGLVTLLVGVLAIAFPLGQLARATSLVTLAVFALVCAALLRIRSREPGPPGIFTVPAWIPAAGVVVNLALLGFEGSRLLGLH